VYLYSNADQLVDSKDIERHAQAFKTLGGSPSLVNFGKSAHVSHARADGERYWGAVKAAWEG
jgi:hypothetical protein